MIRTPKVGEVGELSFTVESSQTIKFDESGMPEVLSTPTLVWFLEHSAREALLPLFEGGEACVGVHLDIHHLAATPLGHKVQCRAKVIHVEGRIVTFQVEAYDERELIARGTHKRAVVDVQRFAKSVARKQK
ncbi:MAG: thioesterase family protein [Planctomycetales bacterium]|nr:thioesterase family protein [Planctomycetales bacterium]